MNALDIKNLTKIYNNKNVAIDDISISVPKGEFFGFLGPNGAGKTTTIKCITGIASFQKGEIKVFGKDVVKEYREARKKIGLSPQEFNMDFFGKVWKILDFVAGYYGIPKNKRRERVNELLEQFNLVEHKDKEFRALSGGLKRRVALARAMVHDPEMLILDEPTAGVDVELRRDLWKHLKDLNNSGKTIFLTSHYLEEVEILCDRIAIINDGKIVSDKPKKDYISGGKKLEDIYLEITINKNN